MGGLFRFQTFVDVITPPAFECGNRLTDLHSLHALLEVLGAGDASAGIPDFGPGRHADICHLSFK